jgi:hypothetical protein
MGWWYKLEKRKTPETLLFGLNILVGLFLAFSTFAAEITVIPFDIKISSGSIIKRAILFLLFRTIFIGMSGGNLFAAFASIVVTVPLDM